MRAVSLAKLRGVVIQKGQAGTLTVTAANEEMVPALQSLLRGYVTGNLRHGVWPVVMDNLPSHSPSRNATPSSIRG